MELTIGTQIGNSDFSLRGTISLFIVVEGQLGFLTSGSLFSRPGEPVFLQQGTTYTLIGSVYALPKTAVRNFAIVRLQPGITGKNIYTDKEWLGNWWPVVGPQIRFKSVPIGSWKVPFEAWDRPAVYLIQNRALLDGVLEQRNADVRSGDGRHGLGKIVCSFSKPVQVKGQTGDLLVQLYPFSQMLHPIGILWGVNDSHFAYFTPLQSVFEAGNWDQLTDSPDNFEVEKFPTPNDNTPEVDMYTPIIQSLNFSRFEI